MKMSFLFGLLTFLSFKSTAQKFYVEKADGGYEKPILDKLIANKITVTLKKDSANYLIRCIIIKTGKGKAKGSVAIVDNKTKILQATSQDVPGQATIFNGFENPKKLCMKRIANKYLILLIAEILLQGHLN